VVTEECFESLRTAPRALGGKFNPIPYSEVLEKATIPQEHDVIETVKRMVAGQAR
jgi:pyruvate/2-oxoglutarate/acetoin dehydrogenase E1 component